MGTDVGGDCSCTEARAHLEAFLDHECDGDLSSRLARHVADCEHCSRVADAENHLREILRSCCAEQAPPELRERVIGRLSVLRAATASSSMTVVTDSTTVVSDGTTTVRSRTVRVTRSQS